MRLKSCQDLNSETFFAFQQGTILNILGIFCRAKNYYSTYVHAGPVARATTFRRPAKRRSAAPCPRSAAFRRSIIGVDVEHGKYRAMVQQPRHTGLADAA
jgi:hypothetical protein